MFNLGHYPPLLPIVGAPDEVDLALFSPREIAQAEFVLRHGTRSRYDELIAGLSNQITALRAKDSLYSKLGIYGKNTILDALDEAVVDLDIAYPNAAPHAAIYGRRFPKDNRDRPIVGKILAAIMVGPDVVKVTDSTGIFGDPYWGTTATPEGRLNGRKLTLTSGPTKGESYVITAHVYEGLPYIKVEEGPIPIAAAAPGTRFKIDGDGLPQDDLDKWDRGNDWMIVTAIRGTLTAVNGGSKKITCDAVFRADGYWIEDSTLIPGSLIGRTITVDGVGDFAIVDHDAVTNPGTVTLDSVAGIVGNETFRIKARSPAETGKQSKGTLAEGNVLEPTTKARVSPSSVASLGAERADAVRNAQQMVKRYGRLRWHKYHGTVIQLRYLSRNAITAVQKYEDEREVGDDIRLVANELGIVIEEPEPLDPPTEPPTEE